MKKLYIILAVVALLIAIPAVVFAGHEDGVSTGRAQLHPTNQSGIKAVIHFVDNGSTLWVKGEATGPMTGSEASLLYDNGSSAGRPGKADGRGNSDFVGFCEPVAGGLGLFKMAVVFPMPPVNTAPWADPDGDGVWTFSVAKTGAAYVSLEDVRTISIRLGRGFENVLACGVIADHPGG